MMKYDTDLPITAVIPDIRRTLAMARNGVLEAPPGAGKTTIVPLALLNEPWLAGKRIIMLEPRRLAARAAAYRMADLLGEEIGRTVGYRTRLDSRVGPSTRIEVVTEGILTRLLQNDPALTGVGILIFDEFHERSIHADLGLALSLESQFMLREDLRILVMSATLDGREVSALLGNAPIIKSMGRTFPVEVRYLPEGTTDRVEGVTGPSFISRVVKAVSTAIREEGGSILVFLPGSGEIRRVEAGLKERGLPADVDIAPLYGELPKEMQDLAIRPAQPGRRKVVLATSIAETSLTIDGIRVVIDGGLMRTPRFSPGTGMSQLETIKVTKDSALQRSGRAGRLGPGVSIRLWGEPEDRTLREKKTPEIMESDLAPLALELAIWGVKDPSELRFIDPPPGKGIAHARETLVYLGAADNEGKATEHGRMMVKLPLHPRLSHMVLKGRRLGFGSLACNLSALLTERDIVKTRPENRDPDIRRRLEALMGAPGYSEIDKTLCGRIRTAARQLKKQLGIDSGDSIEDIEKAGILLAFAYPDRVAKRREGARGRYLLANGRGAYLPKPELSAEKYIVATGVDQGEKESRIFLAAPVEEADLLEYFSGEIEESEVVEWDQAQKGASARRQRKLRNLVLSDVPLENPDNDKLRKAFLSGIRQNGLNVLPWDKKAENLRCRIGLLHRISKETGIEFPDISDERLLDTIEEWLAPRLDGVTRLGDLKKIDMEAVVTGMLTWEQKQALNRLAPTHLTVPSGSRVHIDYTSNGRPVLAVRLQEMFGLDRTPSIVDGKVTLVLHLLSPAGRPVQVTEDLAGFWRKSYAMVTKELKGRYPKHYWPDDPMEAEPTRGVKRKPRER